MKPQRIHPKRGVAVTCLFLVTLLACTFSRAEAQRLDFNKTVSNISTGGDGLTASQGQILEYSITAKNLQSSNITNAQLYDYIPAGTSYVSGSTKLNGNPVADNAGKMPYSVSGGFINSPNYMTGVLTPGTTATITFRVIVTANGGTITNFATIEASYNATVISQNTNSVFTNLAADAGCSIIYQSTASSAGGSTFRYIRTVNTTNGTAGPVIYNGSNGPCYNAITGAALSNGSILVNSAAIAYDKTSNRIYFVNNSSSTLEDLCYIDLNASPVVARRFVGYPLEITTKGGWNVNRMTFSSDGYGYAITSNAADIIRFHIDPVTDLPVISRMGALINDNINGNNNILAEGGGDIFGDGSGKLYLVANSSKLYKIDPNTRIATFLGSVNPFPGTSNSMAIDASGTVFIGGSYQNVFTVNLATMAANSITGGSTSGVYTNADYTSCALPVLAPALSVGKTYRNLNGNPFVVAGDTIEYIITVTNTGNINAAGVKLYDSIPSSMAYIQGSTKLNSLSIADAGNMMPFAVMGGRFIHSPGEQDGILRPGAINQSVVSFMVIATAMQQVCNQSRITLMDANGNNIFINSDDTTQQGSQNSTCFFSDGALPVKDLDFKGSFINGRYLLNWSMKDEALVQHYELQYSHNGYQFSSIGGQAAKKNTGGANYSFHHEMGGLPDQRYYRLKVISNSGSYFYSDIIRISRDPETIKVHPNPFTDKISIRLKLQKIETIQVQLKNQFGFNVATITKKLPAGTHTIILDTPVSLGPGIYFLEVISDAKPLYQEKLLKQK